MVGCRRIALVVIFIAAFTHAAGNGRAAAQAPTTPETDGTYRNPVLTKDQPADPHVILVDGTYYLYPTTHTRGYDAWTSKDLVHWDHRRSVYEDPRSGAWAPDVFHHERGDGKFYLYYTVDDPENPNDSLGKLIGVAVAEDPLGPFEDRKVLVRGAIDAHLYQDEDGRLYLYYAEVAGGFKMFVQPMKDPLTKSGERIEVIRPTEPWEMISGEVTEGPWMLKRNGTYYLMYSGTGADSPNYAIGYTTSKSPTGPFKKHPGNPIAHRGKGIFGPGHHSVVTGPDGKLWMIYHQKYNAGTNYRRFTALDPLWFDDAGIIHARVTRGTKESAPAKND